MMLKTMDMWHDYAINQDKKVVPNGDAPSLLEVFTMFFIGVPEDVNDFAVPYVDVKALKRTDMTTKFINTWLDRATPGISLTTET